MTQEFVTYKQALALKELGFDEPCLALYGFRTTAQSPLTKSIQVTIFYDHPSSQKNADDGCVGGILAPLKQQVFRWFRDNHRMYHDVTHRSVSDKWEYSVGKYWVGLLCWGAYNYKTYEEAEDASINKLIEILKYKP